MQLDDVAIAQLEVARDALAVELAAHTRANCSPRRVAVDALGEVVDGEPSGSTNGRGGRPACRRLRVDAHEAECFQIATLSGSSPWWAVTEMRSIGNRPP